MRKIVISTILAIATICTLLVPYAVASADVVALTGFTGFELGSASAADFALSFGGTAVISSATKHTGGWAGRVYPTAGTGYVDFINSGLVNRVTIWVYITSVAANGTILLGSDQVTTKSRISVDIDGTIHLIGSNNGVLGTYTMGTGAWHRIDYSTDGTAGAVYVDGVSRITSASNCSNIYLIAGPTIGAITCQFFVDDAAWDTTASTVDLGDIRVAVALGTGAGDTTGFTPSTGSNYACVNEWPNSDTKYVSHAATATDLYHITDSASLAGWAAGSTVLALNLQLRTKRTGTSTCQFDVKDSGTEYATTQTITTSTAWYSKIYLTQPNGAGAWTNARFDAFQIGSKVTAGTMTVYEEYAQVAYLYSVAATSTWIPKVTIW